MAALTAAPPSFTHTYLGNNLPSYTPHDHPVPYLDLPYPTLPYTLRATTYIISAFRSGTGARSASRSGPLQICPVMAGQSGPCSLRAVWLVRRLLLLLLSLCCRSSVASLHGLCTTRLCPYTSGGGYGFRAELSHLVDLV